MFESFSKIVSDLYQRLTGDKKRPLKRTQRSSSVTNKKRKNKSSASVKPQPKKPTIDKVDNKEKEDVLNRQPEKETSTATISHEDTDGNKPERTNDNTTNGISLGELVSQRVKEKSQEDPQFAKEIIKAKEIHQIDKNDPLAMAIFDDDEDDSILKHDPNETSGTSRFENQISRDKNEFDEQQKRLAVSAMRQRGRASIRKNKIKYFFTPEKNNTSLRLNKELLLDYIELNIRIIEDWIVLIQNVDAKKNVKLLEHLEYMRERSKNSYIFLKSLDKSEPFYKAALKEIARETKKISGIRQYQYSMDKE